MSILLITHDLGVVAETADRLAVMYAGQIVETAGVEDFFRHPQHPYSRKLFASQPETGKRGERLSVIEGSVPALDRIFPGCRFAPRCDQSLLRCEREVPAWRQIAEDAGLRCLLYGEEPLEAADSPVRVERMTQLPAPAPGEPLLAVKGLKVHFPLRKGLLRRLVGQVRAVDGIDLHLCRGRTLALVGESGCGKTTAGKAILQLIRPTAGSVRFEGVELTRLKGESLRRRRADLQLIFQDPMAAMNPRMRVAGIIEEGMRAQSRYGKSERRQRVAELLKQVGLDAASADRYPHEFSGGQRQRICVARALAVEPRLIVCDEPTSALDVSVQAQILNLLKTLQQRHDLSYLFITHNISVVAYLADEVAVMYLGRIVETGRVDEVLEHPAHPYTQALLSAVPVPDPAQRRSIIQLAGDMPSPLHPPGGCHFHPRCPQADDACRKAFPQKLMLGATHQVSCWHAGKNFFLN